MRGRKTPNPVDVDHEDHQDGLGSLYMATFLDSLGAFMFLPLVAFLGRELHATPQQISYMSASYALAQFVFTPLLGTLSDSLGRKRVLLITLGGCSVALFLTAFVQTPGQLIFCRTLHGAFASTVGICEAIVADRSDSENRAANVAKVMGFVSVGMSIGPTLGAVVGALGFHTLCLSAGGVTAFNVWWLFIQLPVDDLDVVDQEELDEKERLDKENNVPQRPKASFEETLIIVTSPRALILFFLTFLQTAYVGVFLGVGSMYLMDVFHWDKARMAEGNTLMSCCVFVFQMALTGPAVKLLGESGATIVGNIVRAISSLLLLSSQGPFTPWSVFILLAVTQSCIDPCMASMVAGLSGEENRGSVMGVYQSLRSLGEVFGPLVAGQMYGHDKNLPILFQLVLAVLSCLVPREVGKSLASIGLTELTIQSNAPRPWKRLLIVFLALFVCSGLSPGMLVWVDILAGYRVLFKNCQPHGTIPGIIPAIPDPFYCDHQYAGLVLVFVVGNFIASFSILPMLSWMDRYGPLTISTVGGGLCCAGYLLLMLALWLSFLEMPVTVVMFALFLAVAIADSGAKLAATALQGFAWHFDGSRIVVFLMAMLCYGMSGFIPVALLEIMTALGLANPFHPLFLLTCLVGGGVIILYINTPSQEEYYNVAKDVLGVSLKQFDSQATVAKVLGSANRLLRKNAPRHFFFVVTTVCILTWVTVYQGFTGNYGLDLFLDVEADLDKGNLPDFKQGRELVILVMVGTCFCSSMFSIVGVVLTELYGWVAILLMVAVLHGLSFTTIGSNAWGGQFFTAVLASVCREMVIIIEGKYLSAYTPPKKLASVTCVLNCYISFGQVLLLCVSLSMIQAIGKRTSYLILVGIAGFFVVVYAVYSSFMRLPRSPVLLREEERELCESYGCSNLQEVLAVMGFEDREAVLQMLSSSDREVQFALMMSIKVDYLEENLYQQSLSSLVSMLRRGFAWTQGSASLANMRMLQGSPGSFAITPHLWSQFWKRQVDTQMFNAVQPVKTDKKSKEAEKARNIDKIVRTVSTVLIRVVAGGENSHKKFLIQCSEEFPDGRKVEKHQLPTTKRSESDTVQECVKRNLRKYAMAGVKIEFDYDKPEIVEEPYESPTYPGVITMYRKEIICGTVEEKDPETLNKIALPIGGEWTTKDEANYRRRASWMTEIEARNYKIAMDGRSQVLMAANARKKSIVQEPQEHVQTEAEKQELHLAHVIRHTGNIIKSFEARKYTKPLVKHLRSRNRASLLQWMRTENADGVCEAFEDLESWVQADAKYLMRTCLELMSREDLVELLKKRVQLKRLIIFIMKYELIRFQSMRVEARAEAPDSP